MGAHMTSRTVILLTMLSLMITGCAGGAITDAGEVDGTAALEKRLLRQQQKVAQLESQVAALRADRYELRQLLGETKQLIRSLEDTGKLPREKETEFKVVRVGLGFLTTAIDTDGKKGDDAIAAYVYLYDREDFSLRRAGSFRFELFDLSRSEDQVIGVWTYPPEVAAKYWGRFPAGYHFKLPLAGPVGTKQAILKVTFNRPGEKVLNTTRRVAIELP